VLCIRKGASEEDGGTKLTWCIAASLGQCLALELALARLDITFHLIGKREQEAEFGDRCKGY
jgi:hypothetical protein